MIDKAFNKLRWVSIFALNLGVKRKCWTDKHWVYFPEPKYVFFRVGFPMNFSRGVVPENRSSLYAEVSYSRRKPLRDKKNVAKKIINDLLSTGILNNNEEIEVKDEIDIKYAYPVYDSNYSHSRKEVFNFLNKYDIITAGRFGSWKYMSMEDSLLDGKRAAKTADFNR